MKTVCFTIVGNTKSNKNAMGVVKHLGVSCFEEMLGLYNAVNLLLKIFTVFCIYVLYLSISIALLTA